MKKIINFFFKTLDFKKFGKKLLKGEDGKNIKSN